MRTIDDTQDYSSATDRLIVRIVTFLIEHGPAGIRKIEAAIDDPLVDQTIKDNPDVFYFRRHTWRVNEDEQILVVRNPPEPLVRGIIDRYVVVRP